MHGNTFNYIEIKTILYTNVIWQYYICVTEGQVAPVDTLPIVGAVDIMTGEGASTGVSSSVTTSETSVSSFLFAYCKNYYNSKYYNILYHKL
jgi:hypothetical protein